MYLLYVDESGSPEVADAPFVVGGIAVREDRLDDLRRSVDEVLARHLDPHLRHLELHAGHVRNGAGTWRGIPAQVRRALSADVVKLLGTRVPNQRLFAVARSPNAVPHADPLERVFEELLLRFSSFLKRTERGGARSFGLVVADEAKYEAILQPVVHAWREVGTRFGKLTRIVEVPLFVDSQATRMIQLADFVAHAVYRHYSVGDETMTALLSAFDASGARLHGLTHLTPLRFTCGCPACQARRAGGKE